MKKFDLLIIVIFLFLNEMSGYSEVKYFERWDVTKNQETQLQNQEKKSSTTRTSKTVRRDDQVIYPKENQFSEEELWGTPIIDANGNKSYQMPPEHVTNLASTLTPEAADKYLEAETYKISVMRQSAALVQEAYYNKKYPKGDKKIPGKYFENYTDLRNQENSADGSFLDVSNKNLAIFYFSNSKCPKCVIQMDELVNLSEKCNGEIYSFSSDGQINDSTLPFPMIKTTNENQKYKIYREPTLIFVRKVRGSLYRTDYTYEVVKVLTAFVNEKQLSYLWRKLS